MARLPPFKGALSPSVYTRALAAAGAPRARPEPGESNETSPEPRGRARCPGARSTAGALRCPGAGPGCGVVWRAGQWPRGPARAAACPHGGRAGGLSAACTVPAPSSAA